MNDDRLERLLAAFVSGDGPADMRERVLARLAIPARRGPSARAWLSLAAAAVVLAALIAHPWRDHERPVQPSQVAAGAPVARPAAAAATPIPTAPSLLVRRAARAPRAQFPSFAPLAVQPVEVTPLVRERVEIERLAEARLAIPPPLEISPLEPSSD